MEVTPLIYFIIPQFEAKGLLSTGILCYLLVNVKVQLIPVLSAAANAEGINVPQFSCSSLCGDGHTTDTQGNCVDINECESECKEPNMVRVVWPSLKQHWNVPWTKDFDTFSFITGRIKYPRCVRTLKEVSLVPVPKGTSSSQRSV